MPPHLVQAGGRRLLGTRAARQASASSQLPPIPPRTVPISYPGAGLCEHLHLGCDQASPRPSANFADLDLVQVVPEDTFVETVQRTSSFICTRSRNIAVIEEEEVIPPKPTVVYNRPPDSFFRLPEIAFPERLANSPTTSVHTDDDHNSPDGCALKPVSGQTLESRSLTSLSLHIISSMATTAITPTPTPGSPPELSASRSSKSSSYSSTFSSPDGLASDMINFEDIGLDDDKPTPLRPYHHSRDLSTISCTSQNELMSSSRTAVPGEKRPILPQLQTHVRASQRADSSTPTRRFGSRTATNNKRVSEPIVPLSASATMRTRSSSPPIWKIGGQAATTSLSAGGLRPMPQAPGMLNIPRRASWQPQRKTVRELEAEYHDSDDELPDDASLFNVPVSPFATTGNRSHRSSFKGSPEREALSPGPFPLAHAKTTSEIPQRPTTRSRKMPRNRSAGPPRSMSLTPTLSNPSSPRRNAVVSDRRKSWHMAVSELGEEARAVSAALEYHADLKEREKLKSLGTGSSRESLDTAGQDLPSRHTSIQLPPVQKGNLDFMPISKEKEAILSRTRPSWLPPKDPKEERKHLREYQQMMAASMEAEKKRRDKLQVQQCEKDTTRESLSRIWHYYLQDTTDLTTIDRRVDDLCWRGITPNFRGRVWQRKLGNPLGLTHQTYEKALQRAKEIKRVPRDQLRRSDKSMERWFVDIERDAETAYPELKLFQRDAPLWQDLVNLCEAYACYRSDIGYMYGIQLIGALLLLQLPSPADAFILLANCLNRTAPLAFQTDDTAATSRIYHHAVSTLNIKFPRLHEYLFGSIEAGGLGFTGEEVFEPMFRTIFSNGLDLERLCRVWDIWIFEGDRTLVRVAVAILGCLGNQLFEMGGDVDLKRRNIQEMLGWGPFNRQPQSGHWNLSAVGDEEKFVEEVRLAGLLDYTGK